MAVSGDPGAVLVCPVPECSKAYAVYESLRSHLNRQHPELGHRGISLALDLAARGLPA